MFSKTALCIGLSSWQPMAMAALAPDPGKAASHQLASGVLWQWGLGLLLVLVIFLLCVAMLRKVQGIAGNGPEKMRIVGGIALGMREKVVLLQVGKTQVLLAVTPGRIQTLHVLEGDDCLPNVDQAALLDNSFAQKLMQAIKARPDA